MEFPKGFKVSPMDLKFILLCFLWQAGKTFIVIEGIEKDLEIDDKSVHIVFTMKTIIAMDQFNKRLNIIRTKYGKDSVISFSSAKNSDCKNKEQVISLFKKTIPPKVIICCSHKKRFNDMVKIINELPSTNVTNVFIYFDELHEYINLEIRKQIEELELLPIVKKMTAITATPNTLWLNNEGYFSRIKKHIIAPDRLSINYSGHQDINYIPIDDFFPGNSIKLNPFDDESERINLQYIKAVLEKYPLILSQNSRTFIPLYNNAYKNMIH